MSEWTTNPLGSMCVKIGSGATPTGGQESYKDEGISLIRSQNVDDFVFLYDGLAHINDEQAHKLNLENGSTGIKNLDYKALLFSDDYKMLFPNEEAIMNFDIFIQPYFTKVNRNKQQIQTLQKLRDTLLPKLISGEVRLKQ